MQVSALSGSREGSPVSLNIRTGFTRTLKKKKSLRLNSPRCVNIFILSLTVESDQSVVGTVTSLQVQEAQGEDVRITWVGVQGATAYRVTWRRTDGGFTFVFYVHRMFF